MAAPSAPAAPTVTPTASTEATAQWIAPFDGGSAITGYRARIRVDETGSAWANVDTSAEKLSAKFEDLIGGTTYRVRVRANNADGAGAWSPNAYITMPEPFAPGEGGVHGTPGTLGLWHTLDQAHWEEGYDWGEDEFREEIGQNLEYLKMRSDQSGDITASYAGQKLFSLKGRPLP